MNLNCPVTQTWDMNQHLHYGASFQQSQDGDGANTAFISNPRINKQPDDFHMYNDSWLAKMVICSTPPPNPDKLAAVVPNVFCPNKFESFAQPDNVFPEQGLNTSENEILTSARNIYAGHSNYSFQTMQDYTISSSAVTTENQAAVVPSSDSNNNIPMLTDVGFLDDNTFPAEDIGNGFSPFENKMTYYQTPFASPKTMQDHTIAQIPSSAVTTENQAAVVPSSDSNNIPMLTDFGFLADNTFPAEDIGNGFSPIKNEMTYYQTPCASPKNITSTNLSLQPESTANRSTVSNVPQLKRQRTRQKQEEKYVGHVHEVPIVPRRRKPRKPKPLEMFNGNGAPLLWQFILQLIISNTGDVCWTYKAPFEFKIKNPDNVARLWGKAKGNTDMNYVKLSRSIRYYYRKNIISKKDRKQHHVYRFVCDIVEILGYDPTVCPPKPGNSTASQDNTEETHKPCSTEMDETNIRSTQAPGQGIPCSFPNVGAGDLFALDKANESEIGVDEILFPLEYPPIPDAFSPSDNGLETQQQYDCQFPSFDASSFEGFV